VELLRILQRESRVRPGRLVALTVISALATVVVIATVSSAAQLAAKGSVSLRLAGIFIVATALYAVVQKSLMSGFATEVEGVIHRVRQSLFAGIRAADLMTLRAIGRGPLFAAITQNTQTISRNLPLVVIGSQQLVLVAFICFYIATLSLPAFAFAVLFCGAIVWAHLARMKALGIATDHAMADEGRLFEGLGGLLHGLKEVRMSARRADALVADLAAVSVDARHAKSGLKARWAHEFALIQLAFYALVGLMVFVVPMFTADFHEVAFPGTMAALFLIGPVGTVATAIPAIEDAERALQAIRKVEADLREAANGHADDTPITAFAAPVTQLGLRELRFAYPGTGGEPGFSVGPLSADFRAGQITFITGGNGSGKSTMMMLLTGLMPAQGGSLLVNGEPLQRVATQAWRNCISAVFADYHLFSRLYGISDAALARMPALLELLEMSDKVSLRDGAFSTVDLSAGQRKRLALITALLEDKPVLILDEWAADQDPHFRTVFYEKILPALRAEGKMVICVTHDDRWFGLADQVLHMEEGRLKPGSMA
jgi:putative ATP-binding cassette transporter